MPSTFCHVPWSWLIRLSLSCVTALLPYFVTAVGAVAAALQATADSCAAHCSRWQLCSDDSCCTQDNSISSARPMWTGESKTEMQMVKNQHSGMVLLHKSNVFRTTFFDNLWACGELVINPIDDIFSCSPALDCRMLIPAVLQCWWWLQWVESCSQSDKWDIMTQSCPAQLGQPYDESWWPPSWPWWPPGASWWWPWGSWLRRRTGRPGPARHHLPGTGAGNLTAHMLAPEILNSSKFKIIVLLEIKEVFILGFGSWISNSKLDKQSGKRFYSF